MRKLGFGRGTGHRGLRQHWQAFSGVLGSCLLSCGFRLMLFGSGLQHVGRDGLF